MTDRDNPKILYLDPAGNISADATEIPECAKEALGRLADILLDGEGDPAAMLLGYLTTEDPTYLPEGEARAIAHQIGRDKLLEALLSLYVAYRTLQRSENDP